MTPLPPSSQEMIVAQWEQQLDPQVHALCGLADACIRAFKNDMSLRRFVKFNSASKKTHRLSQALYVYMLKHVGFMPSLLAILLRRDRAIIRQLGEYGTEAFKSLPLEVRKELLELSTQVRESQEYSAVKPESLQRHMFKELQALEMNLRRPKKQITNNDETVARNATKQTRATATRQSLTESETH